MRLYYQQLVLVTRAPECALRRGGWVTPTGFMPEAMLAWQAGEDDEARRPTPAVAMIDAEAPLTCSALKGRAGHSGVKNVRGGNWPSIASLGSEGISRKVEGNAAESWSQRNQLDRDFVSRSHAGTKTVWAHEIREIGWITHRGGMRPPGSSAEAPAGCLISPRPQNAMTERGHCRALWNRKVPAGFQPHARGRQVTGQAKARGNARDTQNPVTRHRNTQNQANP